MRTMLRAIVLALPALFAAPFANALLIVEGDWSVDLPTLPDFSGSFVASFDDSVVTGVGREEFDDNPLVSSLIFTPSSILGFMPTASNTLIDFDFLDGTLFQVIIGSGTNSSLLDEFLGDWTVRFAFSPSGLFPDLGSISGATFGETEQSIPISGSLSARQASAVASPTTLALLFLGILGLGTRRSEPNPVARSPHS